VTSEHPQANVSNVYAPRFRNLYTHAKILLFMQKSLSADALQVLV